MVWLGASSRASDFTRQRVVNLPPRWAWLPRDAVLASTAETLLTDAVIHLEVKQHVIRPTTADLVEFQAVNVAGTQTWLDWCTERNVRRFIHFSSIKAVRPAREAATSEDAEGPNPSPYGESKWSAEERVRRWVAGGEQRSALILRPAVVYGPGNAANVAAMVHGIAKGRFFLVGVNDNVKSLVSIQNLAAATRHLIGRMEPGRCEVYNITDANSFSVRELDRRVRALLGKEGNSPTLPRRIATVAAKMGDAFYAATRRAFPINASRLEALLETTHFSCE
jgi:nucleoside-diphosphate-sugar epimerase